MLWDLIRDFFVHHIFGGVDSVGDSFDVVIGLLSNDETISSELVYKIGYSTGGSELYMSIGDWLSTTAAIVTITIITIMCCLFVYKIIKLIGGLIR